MPEFSAWFKFRQQLTLTRDAETGALAATLIIARDLGMGCEVRTTCGLSIPPRRSAADSHSASWTLP